MKPLDFSATKPLKDVSVLGRALFSPSINLNIKDPLSRFLLFPHRWGVYYGSSFFCKTLVCSPPQRLCLPHSTLCGCYASYATAPLFCGLYPYNLWKKLFKLTHSFLLL